jgi:HK97 gp10 family phage protein
MPIELSGMNELLANLKKVAEDVEAVRPKALKAGAEPIRKAMGSKAPRGKKYTQRWQYKAGKKYAVEHLADNIITSDVKGKGNDQYVEVGPEQHFFQASMLEHGTVKMRAQPFAEPAVIEKQDEALEAMADVVREAIEGV